MKLFSLLININVSIVDVVNVVDVIVALDVITTTSSFVILPQKELI